MILKPGGRLASTACSTELIVVKGSAEEVEITCGGAPMIAAGEEAAAAELAADAAGGTLMGKRYVDAGDTVELLCTKAGDGSLAMGGEPMAVKEAQALPASD